ncbi:carbohydrate sulfotransferase 3-like [Strongylocentrotus purpuratus]|uniref:Sulfotransferase domain-containing protein n=1 Tax=Strongylocentrotus purpuratus TaxID=7668 RepID=A0A7M7NPK3_STRPU|nr:carbohydrate sulfotransferase 3-like [Strongylocentrotus purpuratus]
MSSEYNRFPPVIIIMAQWRFGSSVFGELFNQNSDLFYLFEPLYTTTQLREQKGIGLFTPESQEMSRNILRNLSRCQFDPDFVEILVGWGGKFNNEAICKASGRCRIISPSWMSDLCRKYKGRLASKLIRANLELLRPLIVDDNINLKIVHLVRDPRGSALSRIKYTLSKKISPTVRSQFPKYGRLNPLNLFSVTPETGETVRGMCKWIRKNAVVSPDLLPAWLQRRYYLVRYEDFADTPLKVTQDLYRFVGIPFKKEVQDWVIKNTDVTVSKNDLFSTHRNSHVAATHWIKDLTEMEVGQIEEECQDVLELMGYEPYSQLIHREQSTR